MANIMGDDLDNVLTGTATADVIDGGAGNDTLSGSTGDDTLIGGAGNDTLLGGVGADTMIGGTGDDYYQIDNAGDAVVEAAGEGVDTVASYLNGYALAANTENLMLMTGAISGSGNALDNRLYGTADANVLYGGAGNDWLKGYGGADTLYGGTGNDTYIVEDSVDVIVEAANEGVDTVNATVSIDLTNTANVENVTLTSLANLNATGNALDNQLMGGAGNNVLAGGAGNDTLAGYLGDDVLDGGAGNDLLYGNEGGNDTYVFGRGYGQDTILNEWSANTTEVDTVRLLPGLLASDVSLSREGDDMVLSINGTTDQLRMNSWFLAPEFRVEQLAFADGSVQDLTTLYQGASDLVGNTINTAGTIALGTPVTGAIDADGDQDWYKITLQAGHVYQFDLQGAPSGQGSLADAFLELMDANGVGVSYNDDSSVGLDSKLTFASSTGGTYYVSAGAGWNTAGGSFTLTAQDLGLVVAGGAGNDTLDGRNGSTTMRGGLGNDTYLVDDATDVVIDAAVSPQLLSTNGSGAQGNDGSYLGGVQSLSADGRYAVMDSYASNLVAGDANGVQDVFLKDLQTGAVQRISTGVAGQEANAESYSASISANGRYVVFESDASNLVAGDTNGTTDIFVKDLQTGSLQRVSTSASGVQGDGTSSEFSTSADGRYVVFSSDASNLVAGDANAASDVFVKDILTGAIQRVSTDSLGREAAGGDSGTTHPAVLTQDGRYVIFDSAASNLVAGDTNGVSDIFRKDLVTGEVKLVSGSSAGALGDGESGRYYAVSASADGRYIAFESAATNLVPGGANADKYGEQVDAIYLKDMLTGAIRCVSTDASGVLGDNSSYAPVLSSDGRYLVFKSDARNLVPNDTGNDRNLYIKDLQTGAIQCLSLGSLGLQGTGVASVASITPDGRTIVFESSDALTASDTNAQSDVFQVANPFLVGGGTDTVQASITYTLGDDIENLTLTGTAVIDGTGNALANVITGNAASNTLSGSLGNDTLIGGAGDDFLWGGVDADTMVGGAGNDYFQIENLGDVVTENAAEGTDTVVTYIDNISLAANVENLILQTGTTTGTGNALANTLWANEAGNVLYGSLGNDTLYGGAGNDYLYGGVDADTMVGGLGDDTYQIENAGDVVTESAGQGTDTVLTYLGSTTLGANVENLALQAGAGNGTGNTLANWIWGNDGANVLNGGAGADTLAGGQGNDTYVVDNVGDLVSESLGAGVDGVQSSVTHTLGLNVENLSLTGTAANSGTGNTLDNVLTGNSAANTLTGGAGNDRLDGGAGADKLVGGVGDDTYVVERSTDVVTELANQGADTVQSSVTWTLGTNLENLSLLGAAAINGTGNAAANVLSGNSAANTLTGGAGNDRLDGGAGADKLVGGTGNDTYVLGRGHGAETITENDATAGNTDAAEFMAGITTDQLWFRHVGNNLEVSIIGTTDKLTVQNWYLGSAYHVEQFRTADNHVLLDTQVEALVQAMAAFTPPAAGQSNLPASYQPTLAPVLAANWH